MCSPTYREVGELLTVNQTRQQEGSVMTPDEARKVLAGYEELLSQRRDEQLASEQSELSAEAVAAVDVLYQSDWHAEWLEMHPLPKKGHPAAFDPRNRSRFAKWLAWKNEQDELTAPLSRHVYRLVDAATIRRDFLSQGQEVPERVLRPLNWLRANRQGDNIPEVWAAAVDLAGGADKVTWVHTSEAVRQYKKNRLGPKGVRRAVRRSRAEMHRIKALHAIRELWNDRDADEWELFKAEFKKMVTGG